MKPVYGTMREIARRMARLLGIGLLMLAVPLQAVAAYAPAPHCDDAPAAAHATQDMHAGHHDAAEGGHVATAGDHEHHDSGAAADQGAHSCCHHAVSAVVPPATPVAQQAPHAVASRVSLLNTLFIPELPQRPPRS